MCVCVCVCGLLSYVSSFGLFVMVKAIMIRTDLENYIERCLVSFVLGPLFVMEFLVFFLVLQSSC